MENIEAEELDLLIGRLRRRYPMLPVDAIRDEIERLHRHADVGARDFLSVLIAREVREIRGNGHLAG
jgi:hypothetical protein